jgi:hypothetical protein
MKRVMEDVRQDTALSASGSTASNGASTNGASSTEANGTKATTNGTDGAGTSAGSLALPQAIVDAALKITKECLDTVCEISENGNT